MQRNRRYRTVSYVCGWAGGERETSPCPTLLHDTMIFWKQNVRMQFHKRLNSQKLAPRARFELATLRLTAEAVKIPSALPGVAYRKFGAILPLLAAPNPVPKDICVATRTDPIKRTKWPCRAAPRSTPQELLNSLHLERSIERELRTVWGCQCKLSGALLDTSWDCDT